MDGLQWKTLSKFMIWGYHYFWKHPWEVLNMLQPLKFNSEFTPEKWWLEDDPFLLGFGHFLGAKC